MGTGGERDVRVLELDVTPAEHAAWLRELASRQTGYIYAGEVGLLTDVAAALEAQAARAEGLEQTKIALATEYVNRLADVEAERDAALAQRTDYHDAMMAEQAKRIVVEAQLEAARAALREIAEATSSWDEVGAGEIARTALAVSLSTQETTS